MSERLAISAKTLASMLDVSVRTVWNWHQSGTLGVVPLQCSDRVTRWDRAEVERWWSESLKSGRPIGRDEWVRRKDES